MKRYWPREPLRWLLGRLVRWALGAEVPSARALPGADGAPLDHPRPAGEPMALAPSIDNAPAGAFSATAEFMAELQVLELRVRDLRHARDAAYAAVTEHVRMGVDWRGCNRAAQAIDKQLQAGLQRALWLRARLKLEATCGGSSKSAAESHSEGPPPDSLEAIWRRMRADGELDVADALAQLSAADRHLALRRARGRAELRERRLKRNTES